MPSFRQPDLPKFQAPRYRRPTMTVDAAKGVLDRTEDEIRDLVETGCLVAWDIAAPGSHRAELRILTTSVSEFVAASRELGGRSPSEGDPAPSAIQPESAIAALVPKHDKPFVIGPEVKRILNCGRQHLINLVDAKVLEQLPGTQYRRGPQGWPVIARASFTRFLETRMIGAIAS